MKHLLQQALCASLLLLSTAATAQTKWNVSAPKAQPDRMPALALVPAQKSVAAQAPETRATTSSNQIFVGQCTTDAYIYEYTGIYQEQDLKVSAAVKLTADMLAPYAGCKITKLRVGWNNSVKPSIEAFIRRDLNGENVSTKTFKPTSSAGWTLVTLPEAYVIPDGGEDLVLGYKLDLPANNYIPSVFPNGVDNSCFVSIDGDNDEQGNPIWVDLSETVNLPLMALVEDPEGKSVDYVVLGDFLYDAVAPAGEAGTTYARLYNKGTNAVSTIGISCTQGEQTWDYEMELTSSIEPGYNARVFLPLYCFATGDATYAIKYVNGETPSHPFSTKVTQIGVPADVAAKYVRRPLMEFFTSENNFYAPTYFTYITDGLGDLYDQWSVVTVHCDDQFMTGSDDDDTLRMLLDFEDNDSLSVTLPSVSIDRTAYTCNYYARRRPVDYVLYPNFANDVYKQVQEMPTFASVNVAGKVNDGLQSVSIDVSGDIAEGIMPADEPLYLSVYLIEDSVKSESQKFWDDKEEGDYGGVYTHPNVIRRRLTPLYGTQLEANHGSYTMHFDQRISSKWDATKLGVIAFVNRGKDNSYMTRNVINSGQARLSLPSGINSVEAGKEDARIIAVYNTAGVEQPLNEKPAPGVYIVKKLVNGKTVVEKSLLGK